MSTRSWSAPARSSAFVMSMPPMYSPRAVPRSRKAWMSPEKSTCFNASGKAAPTPLAQAAIPPATSLRYANSGSKAPWSTAILTPARSVPKDPAIFAAIGSRVVPMVDHQYLGDIENHLRLVREGIDHLLVGRLAISSGLYGLLERAIEKLHPVAGKLKDAVHRPHFVEQLDDLLLAPAGLGHDVRRAWLTSLWMTAWSG